jgi:uncharacterized protein YidB (DUF937 family)
MSPITMGLLALLAYKALKGGGMFGSSAPQPQSPQTAPDSPASPAPSHGGPGDWLNGLGGLVAGGAGGNILTNGLGELVRKFQQAGQGDTANSWVGTGPNEEITPADVKKAVDPDTLETLSRQTGLPPDQLLAELAKQLPKTVDSLTPDGRIPSDHEASRWV